MSAHLDTDPDTEALAKAKDDEDKMWLRAIAAEPGDPFTP